MICGFKDRTTRAVFDGDCPKGFPAGIFKTARRKLELLDAVEALEELWSPPGNDLHALVGDRAGQHAIRINDQFRVCFRWTANGPDDVEIVDYHRNPRSRMSESPADDPEIVAQLPPMHPGEVLREEYMEPLHLSAAALARACGVPKARIERIAREEAGISADTALRLGRLFGTSARFWLNLQARYDLLTAEAAAGADLARIRPFEPA